MNNKRQKYNLFSYFCALFSRIKTVMVVAEKP